MKNLNKFNRNDRGASPVVGVLLMIAATIVLAGAVMAMLEIFVPPNIIPPRAAISVSNATGGLLQAPHSNIHFRENSVRLLHNSGDTLCINRTRIVMRGYGQTDLWTNIPPYPILVTYSHIHSSGKYNIHNRRVCGRGVLGYSDRNSNLLADGFWSAGEILDLNGGDSIGTSLARSVTVIRMDMPDRATNNNWGFKQNSEVRLLIYDIRSGQVISSSTFTMWEYR